MLVGNVQVGWGNPTKSVVVNKVIVHVGSYKTSKIGKKSKVSFPLKKAEAEAVLQTCLVFLHGKNIKYGVVAVSHLHLL